MENPAAALIQMLDRRDRSVVTPRTAAAVMLVLWFGSLGVVMSSGVSGTVEVWALLSPLLVGVGALLMVGLAGRCDREASLLTSFQRGGCLDEILGTCIGPAELVDGLAWTTVRRIGTLLLPAVLLSGVSLGVLAGTGAILEMPLAAWAGFLILAAGLLVCLSYLALAQAAFTTAREDRSLQSLRTLLLTAAVAGPSLSCLLGLFAGPWGLAAGLVCGGAWMACVSRTAAIWALGRGGSLPNSLRWLDVAWLVRPRRPNRWLTPWNDNPIVAREAARESHRVPLGLLGAVLSRGGLGLLMGLGLALPLAAACRDTLTGVGSFVFGLLSLVLFSLCSSRALHLVVSEHEAKTLPQLLATPLTVGELASGAISAAVRPVLVQYAGFAMPLVAMAVGRGDGASALGLAAGAAVPVLSAYAGGWLGLQGAAPVPTRQQAVTRAGNLAGLWMMVLSAAGITLCVLLEDHVPLPLLVLGAAVVGFQTVLMVSRSLALQTLAHSPEDGTVGLATGT